MQAPKSSARTAMFVCEEGPALAAVIDELTRRGFRLTEVEFELVGSGYDQGVDKVAALRRSEEIVYLPHTAAEALITASRCAPAMTFIAEVEAQDRPTIQRNIRRVAPTTAMQRVTAIAAPSFDKEFLATAAAVTHGRRDMAPGVPAATRIAVTKFPIAWQVPEA